MNGARGWATAGRPGAGGFTLVELLVALTLVGMMGLAVVRFFAAQQHGFGRQARVVLSTQNIRAAVDLLLSEARNAGFDPRGTAGAGVSRATSDSLGWTADLDEDGTADDFGIEGDEEVLYYFDRSSRALMRRANGLAAPMVTDIDTVAFRYFDVAGRPTLRAAEVARMEIFLGYSDEGRELDASILSGTRLPNRAWD